MADLFRNHNQNLTAPPQNALAVVPDDATDLPWITRALYVGGGGDLRVRMQDGTDVTLANASAGTQYALRVERVLATGTTATDIVAMW
ncbi:spike base protein, RCAP_Rcc01079 family [Oceanomicrobium pacificus]|uniref:Uncharacterized protein n=1 Tax=Oceanomicrobium pacificus TaxID=2692916 RepID=A0A6B0TIJ8_9RHOB|nr:hypothetical protein [Oceanomicrobium pacificus]MXU64187.1 hypothetical protein [Oceanomicrobium pacificus]